MILCLAVIVMLINSSYGRAFKAIREDEIAAEAMGINLPRHKMLSFCISSFFAGGGGALFAMYASNAQAMVYTSTMTYEILLIVVIGGIGSISGSVMATFLYVACSEWWLRGLDSGSFLGIQSDLFRNGFRMVVFSVVIMIVVLFFRRGHHGRPGDHRLAQETAPQGRKGGRKMSQNILHVENITMQFGGVVAVNNLSVDVNAGEIVALIGPNGAGKTTAFNCITGVYEPTNGRVDFLGQPMIRNHPQGKMAKSYSGQNAALYTAHPDLEDPEALAAIQAAGDEETRGALQAAYDKELAARTEACGPPIPTLLRPCAPAIARPDHPPGRRPDLPEHPPVFRPDRV